MDKETWQLVGPSIVAGVINGVIAVADKTLLIGSVIISFFVASILTGILTKTSFGNDSTKDTLGFIWILLLICPCCILIVMMITGVLLHLLI